MTSSAPRRVVVVTGGAAGIGAGIAEALGRAGAFVVTLDPGVSLDGTTRADSDGPTTVERIIAAGGHGREARMSVTDADAVGALFAELAAEHGSLDAVVNVAGISRPTSFTTGSEEDWSAVLAVHLGGYLTVLRAALPIMAAAGHGRIVGVTSGSGWRPANTGAYGCAKRAVAALTWQLGADPPPGVTVNALSPIAATRMVTAGLRRAAAGGATGTGPSTTGGIALTGFPPPEHLGPVGAYLASEEFAWSSGRVLFSAGAEVAIVSPPRLIEVVRSRPVASLSRTLSIIVPQALGPAEAAQTTGAGAAARFTDAFDAGDPGRSGDPGQPEGGAACLVVSDDPAAAARLVAALTARGARCATCTASPQAPLFDGAGMRVRRAADELGRLDSVILAIAPTPEHGLEPRSWAQVLDDHDGLPDRILHDAAWMRAVADHAAASGTPTRFVGLIGATTAGGRSRAQAATQLSRAARSAGTDHGCAVIVSSESAAPADRDVAAEFAAHLAVAPGIEAVSGAELCVGDGWIGLRSHPAPTGAVNYGGPDLPDWLDGAVRTLVDMTGSA